MKKLETIAMIVDETNPRAVAGAEQYRKTLATEGVGATSVLVAELILVFGGDRTLLNAVGEYWELNIPFISLSYGNVGALGNEPEQVPVAKLLNGSWERVAVPVLEYRCDTAEGVIEGIALNDIALRDDTSRPGACHLRIRVDGAIFANELIGDGVLLATPLGSTAYNASVGGPVVDLRIPAIVLSTISATLPYRRSVHAAETVIEIDVLRPDVQPVHLMSDSVVMTDVRQLTVRMLPGAVTLGFVGDQSFTARLARMAAKQDGMLHRASPMLGTAQGGDVMHYSVGALIERDGRYLLFDRMQIPFGYAGVAGHVDVGEEPLQALVREVAEETGLRVTHAELLFDEEVPGNHCGYGIGTHHWRLYRVSVEGDLNPDPREARDMDWHNLSGKQLEEVWEYWFEKLALV